MGYNSNDNDFFITLAVIIAAGLAFLVFKFSNEINVNFDTGFSVLLRAVFVIGVAIAAVAWWKVSIGAALPALFGGLVWAFCPAIDYWGTQVANNLPWGGDFNLPIWWARWYSKALFVLTPIVGGYTIRHLFSR